MKLVFHGRKGINVMQIWFNCEEENLMVGLETDTKPAVGDTVLIKNKEYGIRKVTWCLVEAPGQSGLLVAIERSTD